MKRRARGIARHAVQHDPSVVMRPVQWPEELVSGGVNHAPFTHIQPYTGYPPCLSSEGVRVVSWNTDGLGRMMKRNANLIPQLAMRESPQVLCLQELKGLDPRDRELLTELLAGYTSHYNTPTVKGKHAGGIAVLLKKDLEVESVIDGMPGVPSFAGEARVVTVVLSTMIVISVLSPPVGRDLSRLEARVHEWEPALREYVSTLRRISDGRDVVICGDLNVAHCPIDVANPALNGDTAAFTDAERREFEALLKMGFVDTFRVRNPVGRSWYSYWAAQHACRERNIGFRQDYVLCTSALRGVLVHSSILNAYHGSDHCPVVATFNTRLLCKQAEDRRAAPRDGGTASRPRRPTHYEYSQAKQA
eukprot:TRINITY_DN21053_c0_g1_i1.p1 TRINITY_DN21053_c0_g1~~TRINITY_DN21053_c0_g1_i1.p1  ORF type:complete len:362 (+),score=58.07 TRINITY_DN21053_c0_g1_i1:122-1207(+)